eukprot:g2298.t1
MYHKVQNRMHLEGEYSNAYDIETGLREGSVLSPTLYTIFVNELLNKLQDSGDGVCIANDPQCHTAAIGYADDLVLVSQSPDGLQRMLDIVAEYAAEHFFQVSQSKSNVVVFESGVPDADQRSADAKRWYLHGMYNDCKDRDPDHLAEVDEYQYLGTWFHKDRTWKSQFNYAAAKFWRTAADKWHDAGAVRMGAGELVAQKLWESMVAPAIDYNPMVTCAALANNTAKA